MSISIVEPTGTMAVSFQTRLSTLHAVHRQDEEALPVNVDRVVHRVEGVWGVEDSDLHHVTHREAPVDILVLPLPYPDRGGSTWTCSAVESQFIIGMASFHSIGGTYSVSASMERMIDWWKVAGPEPSSRARSRPA